MKLVGFLYKELKDIFKENKQGFDGKSSTLTYFGEKHMADEVILNVAKLQTALYSLQFSAFTYMVRINYDSATVNISVFIQQRKILFQNDISLKTMRLGVLLREELNKSWNSRQNHELGVKEQLLLISLSCLSPG